jgi:hypothetical protein
MKSNITQMGHFIIRLQLFGHMAKMKVTRNGHRGLVAKPRSNVHLEEWEIN